MGHGAEQDKQVGVNSGLTNNKQPVSGKVVLQGGDEGPSRKQAEEVTGGRDEDITVEANDNAKTLEKQKELQGEVVVVLPHG